MQVARAHALSPELCLRLCTSRGGGGASWRAAVFYGLTIRFRALGLRVYMGLTESCRLLIYYPKALRTRILRLWAPRTILYKAFGDILSHRAIITGLTTV